MSEPKSDYWFPAKSYGWGWGLPVKWQGWLVFLGYLGLMFWGIQHFRSLRDMRGLLLYLTAITVLLTAVVYMKGQRPARWRWGGKQDAEK